MTPDEFAARAVGVEWRKWRADWQAMDCYGLIVLWHREVLGIDLGDVPHTDIAGGFAGDARWRECQPVKGGAWMTFRGGLPVHCGILLDSARVIHAAGSDAVPGSVKITPLAALRRLYPTIRFYACSQSDATPTV